MSNKIFKLRIGKLQSLFYVISLVLFCVLAFGIDGKAQTKKRKKTSQTVVQPTPPPIGVPIIISRVEDIPSENQIILPQPTPENSTNTDENQNNENNSFDELKNRVKTLESDPKNAYDEKQKRLLLNLDILSRAEQRSENLRKQLFDFIDKENSLKTRIEQINNDARPEIIERSVALVGTVHPEEIRDMRKKSLQIEKANLESLLRQVSANRANLEANVQKSDALVEKLRTKLEKDIDDALTDQ